MSFLRSTKASTNPHYQSVVSRILGEVFNSVSVIGRVAGKIESVAYVLQLVSQRVVDRRLSKEEEKKVGVIASKYASSCKEGEEEGNFRYFAH